MAKNSNVSYEIEIHRVDSPSCEDSKKYIFCGQGGSNFGRGTAGKFRENGQKQGNLLICKLGRRQF